MEKKVKNKSTTVSIPKLQNPDSKIKDLKKIGEEHNFFKSSLNLGKSIIKEEKFSRRIGHDILDEINDGLVYLSQTGIILDVNKKAAQFFGVSKKELLGKHFTKIGIFSARDYSRLLKNFKAALSQKVNLFEVKIRNKKGKELYLECSVTIIKKDRFPSGFIIVARDITKQKLSEISLEESKERYKDLVDRAGVGILVEDNQGNFKYFNQRFCQLFGYSNQEMAKQNIETLVHSGDLKRIKRAHREFLKSNKKSIKLESRCLKKDGSIIFLEIYGEVLKEKGEITGRRYYLWDITERKKREEALKSSEERFRILFDYAPDAYYLNDLKGNFIDGNKKAEEIIGYKKEELIGKNFLKLKLLSPAKIPKAAATLMKNALGRSTGPDEFILKRNDGSLVTVEISTYPVKIKDKPVVLGIARDITERKKAQEERNLLMTAINQASEIIALTDVDSKIKYVNPALERISGFTNKEVKGQSIRLFLKDVDKYIWQEIGKTLREGKIWKGKISLRKKDSSLFEAEVTATPVRDTQGKINHYIYFLRDITEQIKLEEQLRQIQKMEALGTLTGGIAHDFNNILTSIIGYTEMALDDAPPDSLLRCNLEEVFKAGKRGQDLVNQILAFSRPSHQQKKPVQVSSLIKETLKLLQVSLPANIKIHQNIKSDSVVMADPTQIHQIVLNLCKNAADAMSPKGGLLEVRLEDVELSKGFLKAYPNLEPGPFLKLSVRDTGIGIEESVLNRIFDPFFTTKAPGQGTGMGLAVVHSGVRNHGGIINVHTKSGEGTTFDIYLPKSKGTTKNKEEKQQTVPGGRERLLFIDDEEQVMKLGKQMLESLGYQVTAFSDSLKAIQTFKGQPENFDLVISDSHMPGVAGGDLATEIFKIRPQIPFIFCTGNGLKLKKEKAMEIGARDIISKPFQKKDLAKVVRKVLDQVKTGRR